MDGEGSEKRMNGKLLKWYFYHLWFKITKYKHKHIWNDSNEYKHIICLICRKKKIYLNTNLNIDKEPIKKVKNMKDCRTCVLKDGCIIPITKMALRRCPSYELRAFTDFEKKIWRDGIICGLIIGFFMGLSIFFSLHLAGVIP
ncbi:hypothetical protein LCGC14_2172970 [marine sediment metagenome]|uniref:Uncharacterized protein n=1 Tax=marine sediment metagenome TaxID=412755 RepID=A0A0F9GKA6_9ZZZZ